MSELKPCPFCGGEAEILTAESMYGGNLYGVLCDCCASRTDVFDTEAEAIKAWNTRAERTCRFIKYPDAYPDEDDGYCSECHGYLCEDDAYCPSCGAMVMSGDSQ